MQEWNKVITAITDFMVLYAWWNASTEVYDLDPSLSHVIENMNLIVMINPAFELAYWRFGLDIAVRWKE